MCLLLSASPSLSFLSQTSLPGRAPFLRLSLDFAVSPPLSGVTGSTRLMPSGSRPGPLHPNPSLQSPGVPRPLQESRPLGSEELSVLDPNPHPDTPLVSASAPDTQTILLHLQPPAWSPRLAARETDVREKRVMVRPRPHRGSGAKLGRPRAPPPPKAALLPPRPGASRTRSPPRGPPWQVTPPPKDSCVLGPSPSSPFCRSPGSKKETGIQG